MRPKKSCEYFQSKSEKLKNIAAGNRTRLKLGEIRVEQRKDTGVITGNDLNRPGETVNGIDGVNDSGGYSRRRYVREQAQQRGWDLTSADTTGFLSRDIFTRGRQTFEVSWRDDAPSSVFNHLHDGSLYELNLGPNKMLGLLHRLSW